MRAIAPFTWLLACALAPACLSHYQLRPPPQSAAHETDEPMPVADVDHTPHRSDVGGGRSRFTLGSTYEADRAALVHVALAEARWHERDYPVLWHVLSRWSRLNGFALPVAAHVRVWRWSHPPKWVRLVGWSCEEPVGWPSRWSWGAHRDRCLALWAKADAFLRGELADECPSARGWRAPSALPAALEMGRREVRCGDGFANRWVR